MTETKTSRIVEEFKTDIASGKFGRVGDRFITTRAICDRKQVSLKTAFHILTQLKEDGILEKVGRDYCLSSVFAPSARQDKPMLIGFLAVRLENPYFAKLAAYAEEFAHSINASMIIASSSRDFRAERERLEMFCRQGATGMLICPCAATPEEEAFYATLPVPCVMLGSELTTRRFDTVLVNNQQAAQQMARHMLEQELTEFAYIGPIMQKNDQRLFGFRAELAAAGFPLPESNILRVNDHDPEACRKAIRGLLKKKRSERLGVFCYHDLFAIRAIGICHELGLRIPQDVAVAGFDDLPAAKETWPPLTSVSYPVRDMVQLAFESLYARIKFGDRGDGIRRYLDSHLIVRESTLLRKAN